MRICKNNGVSVWKLYRLSTLKSSKESSQVEVICYLKWQLKLPPLSWNPFLWNVSQQPDLLFRCYFSVLYFRSVKWRRSKWREKGYGLIVFFFLLSVELWTSPIFSAHTQTHLSLTHSFIYTHQTNNTYANKLKTQTHTHKHTFHIYPNYSCIHKRLTQVAELPLYRSSPRSI